MSVSWNTGRSTARHLGLVIGAGFCTLSFAQTRIEKVITSTPYVTIYRVETADGRLLDKTVIHGPSRPPAGFERQRQSVALPVPSKMSGSNSLTVPAYPWVFGCSAVSGAMIAAFYDRTTHPNIYTGPTNGGVMPLTPDASWPNWQDVSLTTYPSCPLIASKDGVDGHVGRGSIDDYWIQYDSPASDPYITGSWTQHAWGTAIGDYMKTSQSAYDNSDGSTSFYNYTDGRPLTAVEMESFGVPMGGSCSMKPRAIPLSLATANGRTTMLPVASPSLSTRPRSMQAIPSCSTCWGIRW